MVLVEVCSVVVLTTGETTTTWMLSVLADTSVTGRDVAPVLACVREASRHFVLLDCGRRNGWGISNLQHVATMVCAQRQQRVWFRQVKEP